jgi:hypothetical protein
LTYEAHDKPIWQGLRGRSSQSWRLTLTLKVYFVIGLVVTIIGSGYLVFELLSVSLRSNELLALTASVAGLLMAVFSWASLTLRRELLQRRTDQVHEYLLLGRFVQAWAAFEETARSLVQAKEGDNALSVRAILDGLRRERLLQPTDFIRIEEILQLRNAIVHSGVTVPRQEIENAYQMLLYFAEELAKAAPAKTAA